MWLQAWNVCVASRYCNDRNKVTSPQATTARLAPALTARVCCVYEISHLAVWCETFLSSWAYLTWTWPMGRKPSNPVKDVVEIIHTCCRQGKLSLTKERRDLKMGKDKTNVADHWIQLKVLRAKCVVVLKTKKPAVNYWLLTLLN